MVPGLSRAAGGAVNIGGKISMEIQERFCLQMETTDSNSLGRNGRIEQQAKPTSAPRVRFETFFFNGAGMSNAVDEMHKYFISAAVHAIGLLAALADRPGRLGREGTRIIS